jgi:VWFA-related protein
MFRNLAIATLLFLLASIPVHAQTEPQNVPTLHLSAQLVLLDASVEDRRTGARIPGLTPSDFQLFEDKQPQQITYLSEDRLPLSLVFLFDATDSVAPVLRSLAIGSETILDHLRPGDEVAVMTFSSHATLIQDFNTNHLVIENAIRTASHVLDEHIPTLLSQDMVDAARQSLHATIPNSRHVEIWLTDGTTNGGEKHPTPAEARETVLRSNVVVSGLIEQSDITARVDPTLVRMGGTGEFGDYGTLTGGPFLKSNFAGAPDNFAALLDTLHRRYTLGFKPSNPKPAGTLCKLHLELSPRFFADHPSVKAKDITIRARQSYYR